MEKAPSNLAGNPAAGDVVTAYIRQRPEAVYFDYYVNQYFDATVKDTSKEFPKSQMWWTGVFIHGQELNNQIDDFTVTWLTADAIGPAAITDLRAVDSTTTSVDLEWTAAGDNGSNGTATRLELRYATAPITPGNFAGAALAPNLFNGCGQTGVVDTSLQTSLAVRVIDNFGLGVSNYPVQYVIVSGNGAINGTSSFTMNTDAAGEARATWKLGVIAGTQTAEIRTTGLQGSPQSCTATAIAAAPNKLSVAGGNGQVVSINQAAPQPLAALLADRFGNAIANQAVVFNITAGGGYFLNGQTPAGKIYQTTTDGRGQAEARVAASNSYGDTTKITAKWATTLATNFFVLAAGPDSAAIVKGDHQTAARRTTLPESLQVKILDAAHAPVKNYPVTFRILSGEGSLAQNQPQITVNTDGGGLAKTPWTLGPVAGVQQVEVKASFNNRNLRNTPLLFSATAFVPTAVEEEAAAAPQQFALYRNFPNPFSARGTTMIRFALPETGPITLAVYDLNGKLVRTLAAGLRHAGYHQIQWDGRNDNGQPSPSSLYFAVLHADVFTAKQKLLLAK